MAELKHLVPGDEVNTLGSRNNKWENIYAKNINVDGGGEITASKFHGDLDGTAGKAVADSEGNKISETYTKRDLSNLTISNDLLGSAIVAKSLEWKNGYIKFANGLTIQWINIDVSRGISTQIDFPITFRTDWAYINATSHNNSNINIVGRTPSYINVLVSAESTCTCNVYNGPFVKTT